MNNSRTIKTSKSSDLITFNIIIEGKELSKKYQVTQIIVTKEINRIPTAKIVLIDGETAMQDFQLSNEDVLIPGKKIEINAGYHSDEEIIFKGIIIKHSLKIRANSTLLIIECKDELVKLTIGRKSKYFYNIKDSDIFENIINTYGLEIDVESTKFNHRELVQYQTSDWDFIVTRAQANGKLCFSDDGKLSIKKPDINQKEIETVTFGATMMDFDAEIDARNQFDKVSTYGWNYTDQEVLEVEANDPALQLNGNLSCSNLASTIGLDNLELRNGAAKNSVELQDWANAKLLFQQLAKIRGRVKFQGIPEVKPGELVMLEGVGDRFNGKVYVTAIRHEITDGNWTVDAQFGLNPEWFSETYDISPQPASGLVSSISGLQIGIVIQLQEDPDGEDRILVQLPIINNDEQGIWCRIASLDAGHNRGAFFRPEINDEVVVGFVNDDPNDAIVLGMLNSSAKPAPVLASDENHEKGFITRSGIRLMFDDDNNSVEISTPAGKSIVLDEDAGSIVIKDDNSNIFTLDSNGMEMKSSGNISINASGNIDLEGTNINIKANAQFSAEGAAAAEVSTSGTATLKGSIVQIN